MKVHSGLVAFVVILSVASGFVSYNREEEEISTTPSLLQLKRTTLSGVLTSQQEHVSLKFAKHSPLSKSHHRTNLASMKSYKARLQKLYDLDGPQPTDAPYKSWYQDGTTDSGRPQSRKSSLAAMIKAGYPTD
jgi:hypothetical protein